jgi:excisionase family DNA binding protein
MGILETLDSMGSLLTIEQLSTLLGVSAKTLYKSVKSGRLPAYRVGGIRLDPQEVAKWLRDRHTGK